MGVFKLWQLLLTIAQPYNIQQLSGKVLAIDASIWIVKIDSIYNSNAEKIKSILSKIMMLKRNNILPIFVFDGVPPALKRKTLEERSRKRLIANDLQAKKMSQIQIMRIIEGDSSRASQKNKRSQQNEKQLDEINTRIQRLQQFSQRNDQQISKEFIQKIALQSQILNKKYQVMLDLMPDYKRYSNFIEVDEYRQLDLQSKMQYLDELEEYKWKHHKKQRKDQNKANMTQQQKLMHDLQIIQKKSIIREMQDNLFRKMMQKDMKIQNGYQIVQTIYNGKTVIQKRKIKQQNNSNHFGFVGLRKGKMKNDFNKINFGSERQSEAEEDVDPFVSSFCNHTNPYKSNQHSAAFKLKEPSQIKQTIKIGNLSSNINRQKKMKNEPKKQKKKEQSKKETKRQLQAQQQQQQQNNQLSSEPYLPFVSYEVKEQHPQIYVNRQQFDKKYSHTQDEPLNRDNLPNFKSDEHPQYLNASNDNVQLQNLFTILGLPFLIAPGQAEAQCAALEQYGIVDGIVTEDSDTFLFGGKNIYRGVFNNNVRYYNFAKMQQKLRLTRQKLIIFAQLLGSDYTEGVKGIGLVNAMEILKVFDTFQKLQKFKKWAQHPDIFLPEEQTTNQLLKFANLQEKEFYQLHKKFKNYWYIGQSFGNKKVQNAYLKPDVLRGQQLKQLQEKGVFNQKQNKQQMLSKLLKQKMQFQDKQYDHFMRILSIKYNKKRTNTLYNYFQRFDQEQSGDFARIKSKRLQKSIQSLKDKRE